MASKAKMDGVTAAGPRIKRPKPTPFALEPRFVFDAAAAVEVVQAADRLAPDVVDRALAKFVESAAQRAAAPEQTTDTTFNPAAVGVAPNGGDQSRPSENPVEKIAVETASTTLYIVDSQVPDLESIIAELPADSYLVLDSTRDGVRQVSDFLAGRRDVATLAFITDGGPGEIRLGSTELSTWNLDAYAQDLRGWMTALGPDADILLLGCEVAQGDTGELFVQRFAALTGADVAASTDLTGAAAKGGDLVLETHVGHIEDASLASTDVLQGYSDVLVFSAGAAFTVTGDADNLIVPAERTTNLVINVPSGTVNNAQSTGADMLVAIYSGNELIAWQISQPGITNGNGTGAALTINVPVSLLGTFQGPIKINLFQGTRVGGGTTTTTSTAWTSSRGSIALPDFNNQSISTTAASLVTSSTTPGATKSVGFVADTTNSAPVATVPGSTITVSGPTAITGVSVSDADAGYAPITVTLSSANGTMTVRTDVSGGLTSSGVANNGTGTVTLTGSQYAINATLAASNGLQFTRSGGFTGATTITVGVNDGNTGLQGTGGALTDSETINLDVVSAGPSLTNDTASVTEDVATSASGNVLTNDASNGGTLTITQVRVGASGSFGVVGSALAGSYGSLTLNADGSYSYSLDNAASAVQALSAGATLTDTFTYTASNGTGTATATLTVTITGTNDAPVLDATKSSVLTAVAQTAGAPVGAVGTLVSAQVTGSVTDVDGSSPGIAVTGLDQSNGSWYLSTNGGTNWTQLSAPTISALSTSNALLLDPTARLYFRPNGSFAGTVASAVTFRAWDRSTGTAGTSVDTTSNGGSTAFSASTDTAAITVRPAYSLASPDSAFATLLVGSRFDPSSDTQANSSDLDLYGQNSVPLLYGAYDANSNDLYFRVRIDNPTLSKGVPVFKAVVLLGVDATGDGSIDLFLGVDGRNGGLGVVTFDPGSDLNISPSTTSITNQRSFSSVSTSTPATTGFYTYALTGSDMGGDGKQDANLTFRVPFAMLESRLEALLAAKGVSFNLSPTSTVSYVLLTLTQNNSINGDIGGVGKLTTAQKNITYSDLGILQPVSFAAPSLTNVSGSVSYTENGAAVRLAPSATLTDIDSVTYGTGRIAVTLTGAQAGDTLAFAAVGGITTSGSDLLYNGVVVGTISTATGSITVDFNGAASKAAVEAALQALSFSSTSDNPGATSRTASFVVTDPEANSSTARTVTIFVTPLNDAPTVAATPASRTVTNGLTYTIGGAALSNALLLQAGQTSNASLADVDAGNATVTATLSVPIGVIQVYNNSTLVSGTSAISFGGVSVTGSGTGTIVLSGTVADINSFLAGNTSAQLLYQAGSSAADGTQVTVTLAVNDLGNSGSGGALTGSATFSTITIAGAPVLAGAFSGSVREDNDVQGGNLVATGSITVNGSPLSSPTVSFLGNTVGSPQLGTITYNETTGTWTYSVANSTSAIQLLAAGGRIEESFSIETTINGTPVAGFIRVAIDGINDAPTLTVTSLNPTFTELASPSTPTPVDIFDAPSLSTFEANQLIDRIVLTVGSISDGETEFVRIDGSYVQLLAGTVTTATNGYSVTVVRDGTTATLTIDMSGGIGTDAAATLLDGLAYLNTAEIVASSTRAVTVTSVRDTGGTANGGQDSSTPNLASTITLQPLNDGPVLNTGLASLPAGRSFVLTAAHLLASDPDNGAEQLTYTLTSTPQFGVLQYSADGATNWTTINANGATFTQADVAAGRVRYVANSGVANGSVDNLGFTVSDGALTGSGVFGITISNANTAPLAFDSLATTLEDNSYILKLSDFLVSDGDDGDSVSAIQIVTTQSAGALEYDDGGTWTAVTAGQIVTAADIAAGKLRFVPVANANGNGYATFEFKAYDSQNALSADSAIFTVDVTSVNDMPAGTDKTITLVEDGSHAFAASDFGFSDPSDSPANGLASIVITTLPTAGTLKLNGVDVQAGAVIAVADLGQLVYAPAANANGTGYASFTFQVRDDGGTADGGVNTDDTPNTISFDVTAVNDAPTLGTVSGTITDTANDDSFPTLTGNLAGADVEGSTLTYGIQGGTDNGTTVSFVGTYGTLTVTKATGAYSYTPNDAAIEARKTDASDVFTITVSDGTATTTSSFTANITGANDTPELAASVTSATLADSAAPDSFADIVGTLTGTDRDSPETLSYALTGSTAEANTIGGVAYTHRLTGSYGTLYFNDTTRAYRFVADAAAINALPAGQNAAPVYSFVLTDGSGATDSETLTISISGANDAPVAADDSVTTAEDTPVTFDVRINDSDVDGGTLVVTQVAGQAIDVGSPVSITGGSVSLNGDGTLTFTPAANFNGSSSFSYTISDGQGGTATATVNLTVTAVNDAPTLGTVSRTITDTAADDSYATLTGTLSGGDVDAGTTLTYGIQGGTDDGTIVSLVGTYGTLTVTKATGAYSYVPNDAAVEVTKTGVSDLFTITVADGTATTTAPFSVDIAGTNDTPQLDNTIADQHSTVGSAFSFAFAANTFSDRDNDTLSYSATLAGGAALPAWLSFDSATRSFTGTPPMGSAGNYDITVTASDGAATASDTFRFTVTPDADAAVNTVPGAQTVAEDTALAISGISVADADGDLATTRVSVTNGTLTVSLAGGATISTGANGSASLTLSGSQAEINAALATLSYQGNANFHGTDTLTVLSTDAANNIDSDSVTITVTPVNDMPAGADKTITLAEDVSHSFAASDFGFSDANDSPANALSAVVITTLPTAGTLRLNGVDVQAGAVIAVADLGQLVYAPAANASGTGYASFTFQVRDDGGTADGGVNTDGTPNTISFDVTAVNDAPVITSNGGGANASVSVPENSTAVTTLTATDVDSPTLSYSIVGGADQARFTINATTGALSFVAAPNFEAPTDADADNVYIVQVQASDGAGGTTVQTISVTVTNVNEAPASTDDSVTTAEDTPVVLSAGDFGAFSDPDAGASFGGVRITALPAAGALEYDDGTSWVAVTVNQDISAADLAAGKLRFVPAANASGAGYATVGFRVSDGALLSTAAYTLTIDVTAVNDAPVLTTPATIAYVDTAADDSFGPTTGTLAVTDADAGDTRSFAIGGTGVATGSFTFDSVTYDRSRVGTYGTLYLNSATGAYRYEPNDAAIEALTAAAGETFQLVVTDGANASDTRTLTISLTGANDTAAISGTATGTVSEDGTPTASATLAVADRDAGQSVFQTPGSSTGSYGNFTFNPATGLWGYTLDNSLAAVQALRLGQSLTDTLTVASSDGTATQAIAVTINGANDAPALGTPAAINLVDTPANDSPAATTGTLSSTDIDAGDTRSFAITDTGVTTGSFTFDGVTYDRSRVGTYGTLYLDSASGAYRFVPDAAAVNAVAAGATPTESFGLQVTDGAGATAAAALVINVTGANDTPAIVGATNPTPIAEAANAAAQDIAATSGSFSVADRDIGDTLTASVAGNATATLNGGALPGGVDVSALVAAGAISFGSAQTSDGGTRVFTWSYDPAASDLDWLKPGDTLTITYAARIDDGAGAVGSQPLVVTITGTNDAPVLSTPAAISLADTAATDSLAATTGTLASSDIDVGDTRSFAIDGATTAGGPWTFDGVSYDQSRSGSYGTLYVASATGAYRFAPNNAAVNAVAAGQTPSESFGLTVTDGAGASDAKTLVVSVTGANDPAVIGGATAGAVVEAGGVANAVAGTPTASGTLTVADVDGAATFVPQTEVAATYGSFSLAANGAWTYTLSNAAAAVEALNAGQTLIDSIAVASADGTTATVTLTINGANDAPVASAIANRGAQLNTPFSYQVPAFSDVDNATLAYTATLADGSPLPAWLSFNAATRTFTGTPAVADLGNVAVRVTATDGNLSASSDFTISVGNTTPVAVADTGPAGENEVKSFAVLPNDSDADPGDTLTLQSLGAATVTSANAAVNGASLAGALTIVGGEVRFDPGTRFDALATGESATVTVPYTIVDSAGATATATLSITVTGSNDAPVATGDAVTTGEDTPITFDVRSNDSDVDGGALSVTAINGLPISVGTPVAIAGGSVSLTGDGRLTFMPAANFNGNGSFSYTISDGRGGTATATVNLTVTAVNDAPVAQPGTGTGTEGTPITGTVTATDVDGDPLSYSLVTGPNPAQGTLSFNPDGSYRFVPALDFNGTVTFTYKANDGSADSNVAAVTLTVTPVNDAPVAVADAIVTAEDTPVTFDVRTNDSDVDGDGLVVTHIDGKAIGLGNPVAVTGGTVSLNANGTLTFAPAANFNGTPSFGYTISDGKGGTATATVNLTVTPVNDDPSDIGLTPGSGTQLSVPENAPGAPIGPVTALDPDLGDAVALSVDDARFEIVDGQLRLRPGVALDYEATPSVTVAITATDAAGRTRTESFTIEVIDVNEPSVALSDTFVVDGGRTLTVPAATGVLANDNDPEGAPLAAQLVSGPANGVLTLNADGSFTYTPNVGFAGTDSFVYRAQDGSTTPGTATVSIEVRPVPVPPIILPPPVEVPPAPPPPLVVVAPDGGATPVPAPGFVVPVEAAQSPAGSPLATVEAASALVSRVSIGPVFTDPGGYQVTVLPGGGDNLVLFRGVPDQQFQAASLIRFTVPVDAFAHTRTDQTVTLIATLVDGRPLPGWLTFSSARGLFEGVPPPNANGEITIRVIARDSDGREAVAVFRVRVSAAGATESAVDGERPANDTTAKRQSPQLLRDSRAANDIRGRAAKLARSG